MNTVQLILLASVFISQAEICSDWIFVKDKYVCPNGQLANDYGCCEDNPPFYCPSQCEKYGYSWTNGHRECSCDGCDSHVIKLDITEQERWLYAHNYVRCLHDVPPLSWDDQVEDNSKKLSDMCVFKHSGQTSLGSSYYFTPASGENIAMGFGTVEATVWAWYYELVSPGYQTGTQGSPSVGHYTALIWESTKKLGCSSCQQYNIDVCQYADSPPNYGHLEDYIDNIPQTNFNTESDAFCCNKIYGNLPPKNNLNIQTSNPTNNNEDTRSLKITVTDLIPLILVSFGCCLLCCMVGGVCGKLLHDRYLTFRAPKDHDRYLTFRAPKDHDQIFEQTPSVTPTSANGLTTPFQPYDVWD